MRTLFFILLSFNLNAQLDWTITDRVLTVGDTVQVPFRVSGFNKITAYQFCLVYDMNKLDLIGVSLPDPTPIPMTDLDDNFFTDLQDTIYFPNCIQGDFGFCSPGEIRTVWTYPYGATTNTTLVFTLHFKVEQADTLSNLLIPDSTIIGNQAWEYTGLPFPLANKPIGLNIFYTELPQFLTPTEEPIEGIKIYPNPSTDCVYVDSTSPAQVSVVNSVGQLVYQGQVNSKTQPILISQGMNTIRIITKEKIITRQVFKL